MQGSSNIRSYVFRSILLPYLLPSRPPSSAAISTSTSGNRTGNTLYTAEPINTSTRFTTRHGSTSSRKFQRAQPASQIDRNRYISSYQQVRGHDPPTITNTNTNDTQRQTSAQRRSREYLGLINTPSERGRDTSRYAETSAMALRKVLQAYQPNTDEPKKGVDIKGKGRGDGRREKPDAKCIDKSSDKSDDLSIIPNLSTKSTSEPSNVHSPSATIFNSSSSASNTSIISPDITPLNLPHPSSSTSITPISTSISAIQAEPVQYPPIIQKLLSARLFRLAVFHLLSTPEYATNLSLYKAIADHLEGQGAGKLSKRLRRGLELGHSDADSENERSGRIRLYSDPKLKLKEGDKEKLPPNYWQIPIVPLTKPPSDSSMTKREALTEYYNSHLEYFIKSKSSFNSAQLPHSDMSAIVRIGNTRGATTNSQLRKLLSKIQILEKTRGFKPNRETGNLIIGCWLRSSISPSSPTTGHLDDLGGDSGWREYKDKSGNLRIVRKKFSDNDNRLNKVELRDLFRVLSGIIESTQSRPSSRNLHTNIHTASTKESDNPSIYSYSLRNMAIPHKHIPDSFPSFLPPTDSSTITENVENQKEWEQVTRPFAKSMIRSMKHLGDYQGIELVKNWMKVQRKALLGEEED